MLLLKLLVSGEFWLGFFIGAICMYIFKPLVEKLFKALLRKS